MEFSVPLALLGAMLFAVSAALQQRAARRTPPLLRMVREPSWLLGCVVGLAGFGAQAIALHLGSIVVVQALLVTQLLFALPLSTVTGGRRPLPRDWSGAAVVCAGLALLVAVRGEVAPAAGRRSAVVPAVAVATGLIGLLLLIARVLRSHAQSRTAALAVAAGICFCMTAVFLVFAGDDLARRGVVATALDWPPAALAVSTAAATVLVQKAFASGSLSTAMTSMTITDPVAGWVVGMAVFGGAPGSGASALWGSLPAIVLVAAGAAALAASPTLHDEPRGPSLGR
ncbi:DMT family transporter [Actinoallomurus rhizosphaericola]|uniref:DMT family transporter n=1 Tax=Actinoallomurus rhizosphaericola TaxID=2952536 RepID=UPI002093FC2D|nr:DMT family transporter [Actinoallomurus rhizosphaericola]MCO5995478.1 DMT family transporter [Actinoallomurus rhizosphaericola]